jgi:hypothetical protein
MSQNSPNLVTLASSRQKAFFRLHDSLACAAGHLDFRLISSFSLQSSSSSAGWPDTFVKKSPNGLKITQNVAQQFLSTLIDSVKKKLR